jgi:glycosyltransferase involved in cell wall biosynthesis
MTDENSLLVISQTFPPEKGGNASRIHDLTRFMTDEWDVTVVAPSKCYPHGEYEFTWGRHEHREVDGINLHRLWAWQPTDPDPSFFSRIVYYVTFAIHAFLWSAAHIDDHDVVMTTSPPLFTGFVALPFAALSDVPWVLDVRDVWIDASVGLGFISEGGLAERLSRAYRRVELQVASLVTVTTDGTIDVLEDEYDVSAEFTVIPNGVDTNRFKPAELDPDAEPVLIYTGTIGHAQPLEVCMEAVAALDVPLRFRVVGDGDLREDLQRRVRELGVDDKVEFTGFVPRKTIPELLSRATVGIAPIAADESLRYAVPTKLYEYMACGLPVITVGEGEIERVVENSEGGLVADEDAADIAAAIERLFTDEDLRRRMGRNGRQHVVNHYDRRAIAMEFTERLTALLEENGEPRHG